MQVTETLNEGLRRGYQLVVTAAELDAKVQAKLADAQPGIAMKGFRTGKVPMALLRKQHGPRLLGEAMQETIDGAVSSHIDASGDRPAMQPSVKMAEGWQEGDDVVVEVSYEALPVVPPIDLAALSLTRLTATADDAAIDEALATIAGTARTFEDRKMGEDREAGDAAQDGDQVVIDFTGRVDGEPFEGGTATDYPLVLGSNSFIPGFEEGLVGAAAGEERDVAVTFPEGYQAPNLAGKAAVFSCTIKAVRAPKPAEIDDALAKKMGAEDVVGLREQVAGQIAREYADAARAVAKRALLDALDTMVEFDLPPSLVDAEAAQIAHGLWHEEHPEVQGHDHAHVETTDEHRRLAVRRVKLGLLLADIGTRAEIRVTDAELTQAILTEARKYRGQERQFFEYIQGNAQARQQIQAPLFEDKVVDHVFAQAQVEERAVTKDELEAAVEALDEE